MKKLIRLGGVLALAGSLAIQPGCMTLDHLLDSNQEDEMYGGTAASIREIEDENTSWFGVLMRLLDLPFSVAADTLILPVTAW